MQNIILHLYRTFKQKKKFLKRNCQFLNPKWPPKKMKNQHKKLKIHIGGQNINICNEQSRKKKFSASENISYIIYLNL